jgi:hypothetical protein
LKLTKTLSFPFSTRRIRRRKMMNPEEVSDDEDDFSVKASPETVS